MSWHRTPPMFLQALRLSSRRNCCGKVWDEWNRSQHVERLPYSTDLTPFDSSGTNILGSRDRLALAGCTAAILPRQDVAGLGAVQ